MIHWPLRAITLQQFLRYGDRTVTVLLLAVAVLLVLVALLGHHLWIKAAVLAWVVLP